MKALFRFYIMSSIHVGGAVLALAKATALVLQIPMSIQFQGALFGMTVTGYNCIKYGYVHQLLKTKNALGIKLVSGLGVLLTLNGIFPLNTERVVLLLMMGLLTVSYGIPKLVVPINLRSSKGLKIFLVALVWVGSTVFLPLAYATSMPNSLSPALVVSHFIFVLVATLPFEIRDLQQDASSLGTWPQLLGVGGTKVRGYGLLVVFVLLESHHLKDTGQLIISGVIAILLGVFLAFSRKNQSTYYSSFWVESIPIVWWALLVLYESSTTQ